MTTKTCLRRGKLNKRCQLHHAPGMPVPVKKVRKKRPKKPTAAQLAARWARLGAKAALALQRGQRPSYLDRTTRQRPCEPSPSAAICR
jgi:hypothetical protein